MAQNNKLVVMLALMVFAAIGYLISEVIKKILTDTKNASTGTIRDVLNVITTQGLLEGIVWLIVAIICYIGVKKVIESGEPVGPISLFFVLIWIGTVAGLFIGTVIYDLITTPSVTITVDSIIAWLFKGLPFALGPSFAAALGISTKSSN